MYVDVAARLAGGVQTPEPDVLPLTDGNALFYSGELNLIFGDSESGKTWLCLAAVVSTLNAGGTAAVVDLDHNGAASTLTRLQMLGADDGDLCDRARFRLAEPYDDVELGAVVNDLVLFRPDVVTLDSLGEIMPLYKANSNSADDFTIVHQKVIKPLTNSGTALLLVDHLAKNAESRAYGPGGTAAKRRAVGGLSLRVSAERGFTPGAGGSARLELNKDRHGGVRRHYASGAVDEPMVGTFELSPLGDGSDDLLWQVSPALTKPKVEQGQDVEDRIAEMVVRLREADEEFSGVRQVRSFLGCSQSNAQEALRRYREAGNGGSVLLPEKVA